ncbi:MAG: hypothetical protein JO322_02525 [Candidatus Eremiobacteraeota bacterium]|nr:hypothetical protein [Candidatus Eremiobacteraeota bacterium]
MFRALARLHSYGTPPYVVYMTVENGEYHRIAFRGTDEMMNDVTLPTGSTLPNANIYRAFVGPLSRSVHEAIATPTPSATAPAPALDLESTLKTIAVVSSRGHLYDVSVAGAETIEGHHVYHVALHPRRDPQQNALRDLWIDTDTYDVWRADYVTEPDVQLVGGEADLTVDFTTVGNYRIASSWIAVYHAPDLHTPVYRQLRVVRMAFPESLPDWLFDEPSYAKHLRDHEPDYLSDIFNKPPS